MKNIMNMASQAMLKVDLAEQLQTHQRARPARSVNSEKRSSVKDTIQDNTQTEQTEPSKKDREDDFDNVLSGHVQDQQHSSKKQDVKGEAHTKAKNGTKETQQEASTGSKKFNLLLNTKKQTKGLFSADGMNKSARMNLNGHETGALLQEEGQTLSQSQDLSPLALKNKMNKAQKNLPDLDAMSIMSDKAVKNIFKKEGKFELDPNLFEQTDGEQTVNFKAAQNANKNTQDNGQNLQKQLEQQQQSSMQNEKTKVSADDFAETHDMSLAKGNENSFKPTENRTESAKINSQHFGFKGQDIQSSPTPKMVAKAIHNSSTGVNKNFAQAAEMMDPKVKVQIDNHQANVRIATEKAGEIAVRLQMQQEGVTDIKLVGENAEVFNKKDELQAALQAEGLDLGQFNLAQDFEEKDRDSEHGEDFEQDENGTNIASHKVATPARVKNGATLHVQA